MKRLCRHCLTEWVESPFRVCESCDEPRGTAEWREEAEDAIKQEHRKTTFRIEALSEKLDILISTTSYGMPVGAQVLYPAPSLARETEE